MNLQLTYEPYTLQFKFEAGTSRGVMRERKVWFLRLFDAENPAIVGIGEVAPLEGLSIDALPDAEMEAILESIKKEIEKRSSKEKYLGKWILGMNLLKYPAIYFALETAFWDLKNGGTGHIIDQDFFEGKDRIVTNGLIWMGTPDFMQSQITEKIAQGFQCLKLKIGALDFAQELEILKNIRKHYSAQDMTLRVDANGAFEPTDALEKLKRLSDLEIHSIEQPIKAGQIEEMTRLCELSPLPIALDEELIRTPIAERFDVLRSIKPQYIVLKPSLLGGIEATTSWIFYAEVLKIGWWITSALESNVGLNAICQFTNLALHKFRFGKENPYFPQGLGTGGLYHNNLPTRLTMEGQDIFMRKE